MEFKLSIEEIDKHFELRKKELMLQNQQDIEKEKEKWEVFKKRFENLQQNEKIPNQSLPKSGKRTRQRDGAGDRQIPEQNRQVGPGSETENWGQSQHKNKKRQRQK